MFLADENVGVFSIRDIDISLLQSVSDLRRDLTLRINPTDARMLKDQVADLLSLEYMVLNKYFPNELKVKAVAIGIGPEAREFTFPELKELAAMLDDKDMLRVIIEKSSSIYDMFMVRLHASIPMQKLSSKKKQPRGSSSPM